MRHVWRWRLARLVTWELPEPQGPLTGVPLDLLARTQGPKVVASVRPDHLHLDGDEGGVATRPADPAVPPAAVVTGKNGRPSWYATGLRMWFVEHTARSRYGRRRGLVGPLTAAFEHLFGLGEERINDVRKLYTHLFRG